MANLSFNTNPTPGFSNESITFTPINDSGANSWRWDFDSNGVIDANSRIASHIYQPDNNGDNFYITTLYAPGATPERVTGLVGVRNRLDYEITLSPNPILGHPSVETGVFGVTNQNRDLDTSSFQWDVYKDSQLYTSIAGVTGFSMNFTEQGTSGIDGSYSVKLTVDDYGVTGISGSTQQKSETETFYVYTFEPFSTPNPVTVGSEVYLHVVGENVDSHTFKWVFGDGTYSYGESISHVFNNGGTYDVDLVVDPGTSNEQTLSYDSNVDSLQALRIEVSDVTAMFTVSPGSEYPPFTASFRDVSSSVYGITGRQWHFSGAAGSPQVTNETGPYYTYDYAGTYYPVLKVMDISGKEDFYTGAVTAVQSGIDIKTYKGSTLLSDPVSEPIGTTLRFVPEILSSVSVISWKWELIYVDGTYGEIVVSDKETTDSDNNDFYFYFSVPSSYKIRLTITDSDGLTDQKTKDVVATESLSISLSPSTGLAPLSVNFSISGLVYNDIYRTNTEWDFNGDGTYEVDSLSSSYVYSGISSYVPKLRIKWLFTDKYDSSKTAVVSVIKIGSVTTIAPGLRVELLAIPSRGRLPLECVFRAVPNNSVSSWTWEINGVVIGNTNSQISYTFNQYGGYEVTATGTDIYGNGPVTASKSVQVSRVLSTSDDAVSPSEDTSIMEISGDIIVSPLSAGVGFKLPATTGTVTPGGFVSDNGITLVTK